MSDELREKLSEALAHVNENGLAPTQAALSVLVTVALAIEKVDQKWGARGFPGIPSVTDYAASVREDLKNRYDSLGL